jgi:putative transposase
MQYRRALAPGGRYFFTLVTEKRQPIFNDAATVAVLREAFRTVRASRSFEINAIVILPDHIHCIWTLPPLDADYAIRWRLIKTWFTKHCDRGLLIPVKASKQRKKQQAIWQNRYWEHLLRDDLDFERHVDYIHYNPCKHGLVAKPIDWKYSSFHRFVSRGMLAPDWCCSEKILDGIGAE